MISVSHRRRSSAIVFGELPALDPFLEKKMKLKVLFMAVTVALAVSPTYANKTNRGDNNDRDYYESDAFEYRGYKDFGLNVERFVNTQAQSLFGVRGTLGASSSDQVSITAKGCDLIKLAKGLKCSVVSEKANLGANTDMMVLWPNNSSPSHIIACNEEGGDKVSVQRIRLSDGLVEDIISGGTTTSPGLVSCDPAEITPWGTVIVGEENGSNGRLFEIIDPLKTNAVKVTGAGLATTTSDPSHVRYLPALGQLSYEGISVLPNGVILYQDEKRPGNGNAGGSFFKFIPTKPWTGGAPITNLDSSPLNSGRVFTLRLGKNNGNTDFAPGNTLGRGVWVEVTDGLYGASTTTPGVNRINLPAAAITLKAVAAYRPEDQDIDLKELALGNVRICGANTGQDAPGANGDNNFGETFCITDGTIASSAVINPTNQVIGTAPNTVTYVVNGGLGTSIPEYQTLVTHHLDFGMPDNIAFQPGRGNWLIQEDGSGADYTPPRNNDIWDCLDDGDDKDLLADACVKVATLNDLNAETTGGVFNATGREYFVSIQHNVTGHGVVLKITGWQ